MKKLIYIIVLFFVFTGCNTSTPQAKEIVVPYFNTDINYSGRIDSSRVKGVDMYWPGTSISINFEGSSVSAFMEDEKGKNYYNLILDNDSVILFHPSTELKYYELVSGLKEGKHSLQIFKRTEFDVGRTTFYNFKVGGNDANLNPKSAKKKRKIEFYGDSITAGYANEDTSGKNKKDSIYTNNYMSYAAITARNLNAEYSCIAKGGIGIMISWFDYVMPDIYDKLTPRGNKKWDFSLYTPQVVVINLFQNDSWLVKKTDMEVFKNKFDKTAPSEEFIIGAYKDFVSSIRTKYPDAVIICALGSMDAVKEGSPWPGYVEEAAKQLNDDKIYTYFFDYYKKGIHPLVDEDIKMAKNLSEFIESKVDW